MTGIEDQGEEVETKRRDNSSKELYYKREQEDGTVAQVCCDCEVMGGCLEVRENPAVSTVAGVTHSEGLGTEGH